MEELLYRCPVTVRKQEFDLFATSDRLVLQPRQGSVSDAIVVALTSVKGHMKNTPKDSSAKSLIKLFLVSDSTEQVERVLDFQGSDRFSDQSKIDEILKLHSGDAAHSRQQRVAAEATALVEKRRKFLQDRPALYDLFSTLVERDRSVTAEEFWERYKTEVDCEDDSKASDRSAGPSMPQPVNRGGVAVVTAERAQAIFNQYPEAKELYAACVPHLLSEKDFWRRFFSCQFFWTTQGTDRETVKDPIFDALARKFHAQKRVAPGGLAVNPAIDLCPDYAGERKRDAASGVEVGGFESSAAFEQLAKRFNVFAENLISGTASSQDAAPSVATLDEIERVAEARRKELEQELDAVIEDISDFQSVSMAPELPKLITTHTITRKPVPDVWKKIHSDFSTFPAPILTSDMPGVLEATVELTASLANPKISEASNENRATKALAASAENSEFDLYAERISELLRHIWSSLPQERDRRHRIGNALAKQREELESWLARAGTVWTPAVKGVLESVGCAERLIRLFA